MTVLVMIVVMMMVMVVMMMVMLVIVVARLGHDQPSPRVAAHDELHDLSISADREHRCSLVLARAKQFHREDLVILHLLRHPAPTLQASHPHLFHLFLRDLRHRIASFQTNVVR
jgi:hypothetical protein